MDKEHLPMQILVTVVTFFTLFFSSGSAVLFFIVLRAIKIPAVVRAAPMTLVIGTFIASMIIGMIVTFFVSRYLFKPIDNLSKSMRKVAKGDFSVRVEEPKVNNIIAELVRSFNAMAEELGGTEMFRNDFINNFSHEFKTPIVSIRGFARQLQKDSVSEEQKKEYIGIIVSESDRLASMSSNILLLTKFENQQIITDKTLFFLDEQIRSSILLLEKQWSKKNLSLDLDLSEVPYYSNEEMLSHVWLNILGNAIKFTPENGTITVKCHGDSMGVTVKIADTGIGMDDSTRMKIFDKFYQGDSSHAGKGNGLGLPLAKRVVDLAGGKITVKSQPGKGTVFVIRLPQTAGSQDIPSA